MNKNKLDFTSLIIGIVGDIIQLYFCFINILPFLLYHRTFYGKSIAIMFFGVVISIIGLILSFVWKQNKNTLFGIISNSIGLIIGIFNTLILVTILLN